MLAPETPRWPHVRGGRGHYESYYLRAVHPTEPLGVWIRYTVTLPPGGTPSGQLWFTLFDRSAPAPRAVRVPAGPPSTGSRTWLRFGDSTSGESTFGGRTAGTRIAGTARWAEWSLQARDAEPALLHLRPSWLYSGPLPRTKLLSLSPSARFDGVLQADGAEIVVEGWPGMIGHNWGAEHAARWIWLHGLGFAGAGPATWLDLALGRVRLGPALTPWVANGVLSLDGERVRLGGLGRRVAVRESAEGAELRIPLAGGGSVSLSVTAPAEAFVEWDYAQPDGGSSAVVNCSVADLVANVQRPGRAAVELTAAGRAVYELGREA